MTDIQINRAIAEFLGWTRIVKGRIGTDRVHPLLAQAIWCGTPPKDRSKPEDDQAFEAIPDFANDLNAIIKAVNDTIMPSHRDDYQNWLSRIVERKHRMATITWLCITATAHNHCEAFLRTFKLWIEPIKE